MDGIIEIAGVLALLLAAGAVLGLTDRKNFSPLWLLAAAGLVLLNDVMLTSAYRHLPGFLPHTQWNWQGKILALAATLAVASLPAFGWKASGLTFAQAKGSLKACLPLFAVYCLFFVGIALAFPNEPSSPETIAFQLTAPGLEEEPFYRGILLLALDRAFRGRVRVLGVEWGWGAV